MKKLILGLGVSGQAAAKFFLAHNEQVVALDHKPPLCPLEGFEVHSDERNISLESIDQVILSPGIPLTHPLVRKAKERNIEVVGEIELGLRHLKRPAIGITGTNGKTTVTLLATHVLNYSGRKAEALGNVGKPLIASADEEEGIAVIELSSYQLETCQSKRLSAAVILNITPDHLDRHKTMETYAKAKFAIQDLLIEGGLFVLEQASFHAYPELLAREVLTYQFKNPPFPLPPPLGDSKNHDAENLMAAFYLTSRFGVSPEEFLRAYASFKKPPHRIEFVREVQGACFWDDSKGTNIDATLRAVEGMRGEVVLIAGGVDKGFPYTPWIEPFKGKVKAIMAIGEAAPKIERDLGDKVAVKKMKTLKEAVEEAFVSSTKGDNILLSPGCASFDMFRDYKDRGEQFKFLVRNLT